jgi:hypothetical protein
LRRVVNRATTGAKKRQTRTVGSALVLLHGRSGLRRPMLATVDSPSILAAAGYWGGRKTDAGSMNSTFGVSVVTRIRVNLPFFPPLPANESRYWFSR